MLRVKFNVFDFKDRYEISSVISISLILYISPLKNIPPGFQFCVYFTEEEKIHFLLKYGDKINDWIEEEYNEEDEYDEIEDDW